MKTRRRKITSEDFKLPEFLSRHEGERDHRGRRRAEYKLLERAPGLPLKFVRAVRGKLTGRTKGAFGGKYTIGVKEVPSV